jgi:hypothetical protein
MMVSSIAGLMFSKTAADQQQQHSRSVRHDGEVNRRTDVQLRRQQQTSRRSSSCCNSSGSSTVPARDMMVSSTAGLMFSYVDSSKLAVEAAAAAQDRHSRST